MTKHSDMIGQVFNRLTVISYYGVDKGRRILWLCECNCGSGKEVIVPTCDLKNGHTKSCGCLKREAGAARVIDITGQKFGRLTVISHSGSNEDRRSLWLCKCDCDGKEVTVTGKELRNGSVKSCGCLSREISSKNGKLNKKYNTYDLTGEYGIGYTQKDEPFYFDLEDFDLIKDYCWFITKKEKMVYGGLGSKRILLHRLVMDCPDDMQVDHLYQLRYDNRKSQLRIVNNSQNQMNTKIRSNNTSGVKGVYFHNDSMKWASNIKAGGKCWCKEFIKKEDAIAYRKMLEVEHHGEYALKESPEEQLNNTITKGDIVMARLTKKRCKMCGTKIDPEKVISHEGDNYCSQSCEIGRAHV